MICIPITARKIKGALVEIEKANELSDCIELRLDGIKGINATKLEKMFKKVKTKVIVSVREKKFGGRYRGTKAKKIALLKKAIKLEADFIEIDFSMRSNSRNALLKLAKRKTKFILSKYYSDTPYLPELFEQLEKMKKPKGINVIKIVTTAKTIEDNSIIFELIKESKKRGVNIISYCEGTLGRDSRILSYPLGGFLTYASTKQKYELTGGEVNAIDLKNIYTGLKMILVP